MCCCRSNVRFLSLSFLSTVTLVMWRRRYLCWCRYLLWVPLLYVADLKWKINGVTLLYMNIVVLLKQCFTRINSCLYELTWCAGERSVGLYIQISTVQHAQPLIAVNYISDKWSSPKVHLRMICNFVCVAGDLFNSLFSFHTLVLVTFIHTFIHYLCRKLILVLLKCWILIRSVLGVLCG